MKFAEVVQVFLSVCVLSSSATIPVVQTSSGTIQGVQQDILNKSVNAYLGIPYAIPPVGDLRFKKPLPVEPWEGTLNATELPPACLQYLLSKNSSTPNDEDCLYINVWVPHQTETEDGNFTLKPIMVWIHGGSFTLGSISMDDYDGRVLASYGDIIVASMNYRLGIFGFMNINDEEAPGNMGLLDQVLALQWIKGNAVAFGGDPTQITIFGESAGSISIGLHLISPLSGGLFKRAIMQSGVPLMPKLESGPKFEVSAEEGPYIANSIAEIVGCVSPNQTIMSHPREVMECLRSMDPYMLIGVSMSKKIFRFVPRHGDEFLPLEPIEAIREGRMNRVNILTGVTSREASLALKSAFLLILNSTDPETLNTEQGRIIIMTKYNGTVNPPSSAIADLYLHGLAENDSEAILNAVINAFSDPFIVCPTVVYSEIYAEMNCSAYLYIFDHHPSNSLYPEWMAMAHFDDVQFVFGGPLRKPQIYTEDEQELSRSVMDKWIGFAKTGEPQVTGNVTWPKFNTEDYFYLEMKTLEDRIQRGLHLEQCNFWRKYYGI